LFDPQYIKPQNPAYGGVTAISFNNYTRMNFEELVKSITDSQAL